MTQARQPAGAPEGRGGQFASAACPRVYALLDAAAPEPEDGEVTSISADGARVVFHARRCPHGHFRRWADAVAEGCKHQRNCRQCWPPRRR